jgi:hypothetical protein
MNQKIHAVHHHADQTLFAEKEMVQVLVHVWLNILETHTQDVAQNVSKTQIVIVPRHVSTINVKILVLVFVEQMLFVEYKIIIQLVTAWMDIPVMLLLAVQRLNEQVSFFLVLLSMVYFRKLFF